MSIIFKKCDRVPFAYGKPRTGDHDTVATPYRTHIANVIKMK